VSVGFLDPKNPWSFLLLLLLRARFIRGLSNPTLGLVEKKKNNFVEERMSVFYPYLLANIGS